MSPYYKGIRVNAFGIPIFKDSKKDNKEKYKRPRRSQYHPTFSASVSKSSPKNLVVMYDIPHEKKKERDWFRRHLQRFGFTMIQKSVWVGPSPLPKSFLAYVKDIGVAKSFKTFKLAKPYEGKF